MTILCDLNRQTYGIGGVGHEEASVMALNTDDESDLRFRQSQIVQRPLQTLQFFGERLLEHGVGNAVPVDDQSLRTNSRDRMVRGNSLFDGVLDVVDRLLPDGAEFDGRAPFAERVVDVADNLK